MEKKYISENIWEEQEVPAQKSDHWSFGDLNIWYHMEDGELKIAYKHAEGKGKLKIPADISWNRWVIPGKNIKLRITPIMPDRSVLVEPENHFRMLKGSITKIYVRVPVWIKLEAVYKKTVPLLEIPSIVLSNTWFGSFFDGELCYWISSGARRKIEPSPDRPYLAIIPVQIVNKSEEEFLIERICLRVPSLSVFSLNRQLWSDEMKIFHKGNNQNSDVRTEGTPPPEAIAAVLIQPARKPIKKALYSKTFNSLLDLSGFGSFIK